MSETGWTSELVAERLVEAADVLARLPDAKMRWRTTARGGHWSERQAEAPSPAAPAPEAIDRMDEALGWLMLARSRGAPAGLAARRGHAMEVDHTPAGHRPHHGVAALDDSPAQDLDPAERGG